MKSRNHTEEFVLYTHTYNIQQLTYLLKAVGKAISSNGERKLWERNSKMLVSMSVMVIGISRVSHVINHSHTNLYMVKSAR